MIDLHPATPDSEGFAALMQESLSEGHHMLRRLEESWRTGANTFSRPGEILLCARSGPALVGICGRNVDPYGSDPRAARVRHLYVRGDCRGRGIGRLLVQAMIQDAGLFFDHLNVRAPKEAFLFYEGLGFKRIETEAAVTHRLTLPFTSM